jgi:uncharacterized protein (TIGR02391 family)
MFSNKQINQIHEAIEKHGLDINDFLVEHEDSQIVITYKRDRFWFKICPMTVAGTDGKPPTHVFLTYSTPSKQGDVFNKNQEKFQPAKTFDEAVSLFFNWVVLIKYEFIRPASLLPSSSTYALTHLHPLVQSAASSRFATAHYSDAIQKACTALEKAVQIKSGLPATTTGASVMTTAFSKNNALIHMADDPNEQFGFMALYQGTVMALRNHFAHSLTELTDPARALEWLGFISALFYKLDDAQPMSTPPTP